MGADRSAVRRLENGRWAPYEAGGGCRAADREGGGGVDPSPLARTGRGVPIPRFPEGPRVPHLRPVLLLLLAACAGPDAPRADAEPASSVARPVAERPRSTGMDPARLAAAVERARGLPRLHSLIVARGGRVYAETYPRGPGRDHRANVKSASKSILSAAVGIAVAEGKLALDQPVAPFLPGRLRAPSDSLKRGITVEHLLSMRAGLEPTSFGRYGAWVSSRDWVGYVLARPMVDAPGGRMLYSTGSSHLLSAVLTRATGQSTYAYARDRLARPLGIELRPWTTDPQGIYFGGNEMRLTPREMLRFGELYRRDGVWEGRRILPEGWVRESWTPRTSSPYNGYGYGYGWWARSSGAHPVHFAWGYGGQFVFVVPDLELTVVVTSESEAVREGRHLRAVHALLDEEIIPAAEAGGSAPALGGA